MTTVYRVEGFVDDGLQGVPITFGTFTTREKALAAIHEVMKNPVISGSFYEGFHEENNYSVEIKEFKLDTTYNPF